MMLGVEPKPSNDNDAFKTQTHDKALDKLGYRGLFGSGLGTGLGPVFGTSLSANLSASLSANFSSSLGNNYANTDRSATREGHISNFALDRGGGDRVPPSGLGRGINGGSSAPSEGNVSRKESGVELVKPSLVYDIASLILYRCQALPIRLKIALDRLFSVLSHEDVLQVLHGFGWTYEDYSRGYMLQDHNGTALHKWNMVTAEEEAILLQQFLRFGETKNIVQQLLHQDSAVARLDRVARDIREARDLRDCRDRDGRDRDRDYRDRESREHNRDHHREHPRDYRENRDDFGKSFSHHHHQKHLSSHHHHHPQPPFPLPLQFTDPNKPLDPEQLKKFLERNMLFNPFMRGTGDPSSLLRPPHPANPHNLPPTSPLSNFLAVNPSLASSLLANPQLASSLSMLRLPIPPVSLPNLSPSNGALSANFGGATSPMGGSPLNRLQSMQPFDFRKERKSPSPAPRTAASDMPLSMCGRPASVAATSPNSITSGGSIGGGASPSSTITPMGASAQPNVDIAIAHDRIDHLSEDDESSSTSSVALNLSTTTTTTTSPVGTPVGAGPCPGGISSMPPKATTPTGGPPTPPKRSWNPINMGTSLINPVTGKKRVQCNVCLKTFCDKGALKIHFSAVHLREMHKCTVEGCNMMFSSRRSRNRHSANPNPKLHTPHVRRKISPHDGRTSGSHPVMLPHAFQQQLSQIQPPAGFPHLGGFPGQFGGINPLTGLPFIPHSASTTADLHKQALELQRQNLEMHALSKNSMDLSMRGDEGHWKYGSNITGAVSFLDDGGYAESSKNADLYENKKHKDDPNTYTIDEDDSMSVDAHSFKGDGIISSPSANKRKRKSQNPTKFAFRLEDDDLISTDDDDDDDNDDELDDLDTKDSEDEKNEDKELDAMSDDDDETNNELNGELRHGVERKDDNEIEGKKVTSSSYTEQSEISNALRHLEDLSKGNFNHMMGGLPSNGSSLRGSPSLTQAGNGVSSSSPKGNDGRESDRDSDADSHNEELENSLHYSEGFLTNVDVPLDKENPRRCIACGKMFQNHFGVKIHYQNVHLKLMHKCTVDGCNAAFPSKRSRDRHASNLNLHRKLLSTSESSSPGGGFPNLGFPGLGSVHPSLNPEILARLYSDPTSFSLDALKAQLPTSIADSIFNSDRGTLNTSTSLSASGATTSPFFLHNLLPHLTSNNNVKCNEKSRTPSPQSTTPNMSNTTTGCSFGLSVSAPISMDTSEVHRSLPPVPSTAEEHPVSPVEMPVESNLSMESHEQQSKGETESSPPDLKWIYQLEDDLPSPDREGNMPCRFCYQTFEDGEALKNHYDSTHMKDLFRCPVEGCFKVFSSRRKRNSHELNYHSSSESRYDT